MKKSIIISLFIAITMFLPDMVNAQTCQIKGTYDTVQVFSKLYDASTGNLCVTVSSDSPSAANLQLTVSVSYKDPYNRVETRTYNENFLAQPNTSTACNISIPSTLVIYNNTYTMQEYKITELTGVKCENN